jgi:hypothetical protein
LALLAGGCASKQDAEEAQMRMAEQSLSGDPVAAQDDSAAIRIAPQTTDDGSKPWGPTYGISRAKTMVLSRPEKPMSPQERAAASAAVLSRFTATKENSIIRQAIAEHEMSRNP